MCLGSRFGRSKAKIDRVFVAFERLAISGKGTNCFPGPLNRMIINLGFNLLLHAEKGQTRRIVVRMDLLHDAQTERQNGRNGGD